MIIAVMDTCTIERAPNNSSANVTVSVYVCATTDVSRVVSVGVFLHMYVSCMTGISLLQALVLIVLAYLAGHYIDWPWHT